MSFVSEDLLEQEECGTEDRRFSLIRIWLERFSLPEDLPITVSMKMVEDSVV